jgi:hypothetical protein
MTKLEELKAAANAAWRAEREANWAVRVAWEDDDASATAAAVEAWVACVAAYVAPNLAYEAELKKIQEENSND